VLNGPGRDVSGVARFGGGAEPVEGEQAPGSLVVPELDVPVNDVVDSAVNGNLAEFCGWTLPRATKVKVPGL